MASNVGPTSPSDAQAQYEFTHQQNQVIGQLANDMRWVAAPLIGISALYLIAVLMGGLEVIRRPEGLMQLALLTLATLFYLFLGIWMQRAAESFGRITSTTGQDISNLMAGLENLRKTFSLLSVLVKIYVGLLLAFLIILLISVVAGAFRS